MNRLAIAFLALALPAQAVAQVSPTLDMDDPRLQTIAYDPSRAVRLVAFPGANLTVMLLPGEQIDRAVLSEGGTFDVRVTASNDSLNIVSLRPDAAATLLVDTSQRRYEFKLETGEGLAAAFLVRVVQPRVPPMSALPAVPIDQAPLTGEYQLSGERDLRPARIGDDGQRTYIEWGEYQSLPAVFGIGPTGEEEVVDGYMRDGRFTIDRVYAELVFRIDRKKAAARRLGGLGTG